MKNFLSFIFIIFFLSYIWFASWIYFAIGGKNNWLRNPSVITGVILGISLCIWLTRTYIKD